MALFLKYIRLVTLIWLVGIVGFSPAGAQESEPQTAPEKVLLRLKFDEDQEFQLQTTATARMAVKDDEEHALNSVVTFIMSSGYEVKRSDEEGTEFAVKTRSVHAKGEMRTFDFDIEVPVAKERKDPDPNAPKDAPEVIGIRALLNVLLQEQMTLSMDPRGKILDVKGNVLGGGVNLGALQEDANPFLGVSGTLPENPVGVGDSWEIEAPVSVGGAFGFYLKITNRAVEITDTEVTIESDIVPFRRKKVEGGDDEVTEIGNGTSTLVFLREEGYARSMKFHVEADLPLKGFGAAVDDDPKEETPNEEAPSEEAPADTAPEKAKPIVVKIVFDQDVSFKPVSTEDE